MSNDAAIVPVASTALAPTQTAAGERALQPYAAPRTVPEVSVPSAPTVIAAPATSDEVEVSLVELFGYIRRWAWLGFLLALPLAAATLWHLGFGPKVFEAEAKLIVDISGSSGLEFGQQNGSRLTELSAPMIINNHRDQLKSRQFTHHLFEQLTSEEREAFLIGVGAVSWRRKLLMDWGLSEPPHARPVEDLFYQKADKAVRVEPLKDSHIIRVIVRDGDPALAASLANHYVHDYIAYSSGSQLSGKRSTSAFWKTKAEELRLRLEDAQKRLNEFRAQNNLISPDGTRSAVEERAADFAKKATEAEIAYLTASNDLRRLLEFQTSGSKLTELKSITEDTRINTLRKDLDKAQTERLTLSEGRGNKHPDMLANQQKIDSINASIEARVRELVTVASNEEQRLRSQHEEMQKRRDTAKAEAVAEDSKKTQQALLTDDVANERTLYNEALRRMKESDIIGDFSGSIGLDVSDIARPPDAPVSPVKSVALIASVFVFGLVGFGLPIGLGLAGDHLMPLLRQTGSRRKASAVAPSQAVPAASTPAPDPEPSLAITTQAEASGRLRPGLFHGSTPVLANLPALAANDSAGQLVELLKPIPGSGGNTLSPVIASLCQRALTRRGAGILLLTSANAGEGKSLCAAAIAAALSTQGQNVFLMECNPASPALTQWFPQARGYDSGTHDLDRLRYGQSTLHLLPAHDLTAYAVSDLIDGYRAWIARAAESMDWIILDAASLLRGYADVAQLAPLATDILFIHDGSRATTEQVRAAVNLLRPLIGPDAMRGLVMNRVN